MGVNRHGHVSGTSTYDAAGNVAAAYWNGRRWERVPGVSPEHGESYGGPINDHDEMLVGGDDGEGHVIFLYEGKGGTVTPIEPLIHDGAAWRFGNPWSQVLRGLSDDGIIIGRALLDGEDHAFMLVPDAQ